MATAEAITDAARRGPRRYRAAAIAAVVTRIAIAS